MSIVIELMGKSGFPDIDSRMQVEFIAAVEVVRGGFAGSVLTGFRVVQVAVAGEFVVDDLQLCVDGCFRRERIIDASAQSENRYPL